MYAARTFGRDRTNFRKRLLTPISTSALRFGFVRNGALNRLKYGPEGMEEPKLPQ